MSCSAYPRRGAPDAGFGFRGPDSARHLMVAVMAFSLSLVDRLLLISSETGSARSTSPVMWRIYDCQCPVEHQYQSAR